MEGTIKVITEARKNQWGKDEVGVKVETSEGPKWINYHPSDEGLKPLKKGAAVLLVETKRTAKGKPVYKAVISQSPPASESSAYEPIDRGLKNSIAEMVEDHSELYAFCFDQARQKLHLRAAKSQAQDGASEPYDIEQETIRCAASSVYIAVCRKLL